MTTMSNEEIRAAFAAELREAVREVMTDIAALTRQPSVQESESGLPSLELNLLAKGSSQPKLKLYGTKDGPLSDPYTMVETTLWIWDQVQLWCINHAPGERPHLRRLPE